MGSYKLLHITNFYPEYLKSYYNRFPGIIHKSYKEQYSQLMNDTCEPKVFMTPHFESLGVEFINIVSNAFPLQKAWQLQENLNINEKKELIVKQIKIYKPDVLWIDDISLINSEYLAQIKTAVPEIKLLITSFCTNYNSEILRHFKIFDLVITCTPGLNTEFNNQGLKSHLVYFGFEPSVLEKVKFENPFPESEFLFTGSLYSGSGNHNKRLQYIEDMLKENIPLSIYGNIEKNSKIRLKKAFYFTFSTLSKLHLEQIIKYIPIFKKHEDYGISPVKNYSALLLKNMNPPVFGLDMLKLMSKASMVFNQHVDVAGDFAGNIRMFEATGVGSCLVTDYKKNINELFDPDYEVVTYNSIDECIEKIKWLTNHKEEMKNIAKAGQNRTLKNHSTARRVAQINDIILKEMNRKSAKHTI
ncbi:MAG: glycosyltransferase family 1 protein [Bacteroidales bacterium]|nr:glycosyltransferase family 1 protein [Bacteroidales bacterium]